MINTKILIFLSIFKHCKYSGSLFDQDGFKRDWWQAKDKAKFITSTICLINQYNGLVLEQINQKVALRPKNISWFHLNWFHFRQTEVLHLERTWLTQEVYELLIW